MSPRQQNITTQELDAIARLGLDDLRACLNPNPPEGARDRADLSLKVLSHSNRRLSAETNRLSLGFRVARILGVAPVELAHLWKQISGASGEVAPENREPLAIAESTASGGSAGTRPQANNRQGAARKANSK
jgi:hypothetical protein